MGIHHIVYLEAVVRVKPQVLFLVLHRPALSLLRKKRTNIQWYDGMITTQHKLVTVITSCSGIIYLILNCTCALKVLSAMTLLHVYLG